MLETELDKWAVDTSQFKTWKRICSRGSFAWICCLQIVCIEEHNGNAVLKLGVDILRQRRDAGKQVEAGSRQVEARY